MFPLKKTWHTWIITGLGLIYQLAGPNIKKSETTFKEKEPVECKNENHAYINP